MTDLERLQAELARALVDESAPVPDGFDATGVSAARETLARKKQGDARRARARRGGETLMRRLARALSKS